MEFLVLDQDFNVTGIVDSYESIIWTERFDEAGEFELYTPVTSRLLSMMVLDNYLFCDKFYDKKTDSSTLMIIQDIVIESDLDNGTMLKVTGKDLKDILTRRIVWGIKSFEKTKDDVETKINTVIETLVNENMLAPADWSKTYQVGDEGEITVSVSGAARKLENFELEIESFDWPTITEDVQYNGETLYDVISTAAQNYGFGFDVRYNYTTSKFKISILTGRDCTYEQTDNPILIFSPNFENLKNSNYLNSTAAYKNAALVIGEGDEYNVMYNVIGSDKEGMDRREIAITPSDVSRTEEDGTEYGNSTYLGMLVDKANEEMNKSYKVVEKYDGEAEETYGYEYRNNYQLGDICEIVNEWGISSQVTISEVVLSISTSGITIIPTFASIEDEE